MRIGVFDSGVGGLSMVHAIKKALPGAEVIYKTDKANLPYGDKTPKQLFKLTLPIFQEMEKAGCRAIVIACNSVTTNIASELRKVIKIPLVGMEPMVKPAAAITKSGVIAVCATPATLASQRYAWLKKTFAKNVKVLEPDCSDWAYMIESGEVNRQKIDKRINVALDAGADVIVLGCTHYHWIEEEIKKTTGKRAKVIQPIKPVIAQLKRVLEQRP